MHVCVRARARECSSVYVCAYVRVCVCVHMSGYVCAGECVFACARVRVRAYVPLES